MEILADAQIHTQRPTDEGNNPDLIFLVRYYQETWRSNANIHKLHSDVIRPKWKQLQTSLQTDEIPKPPR